MTATTETGPRSTAQRPSDHAVSRAALVKSKANRSTASHAPTRARGSGAMGAGAASGDTARRTATTAASTRSSAGVHRAARYFSNARDSSSIGYHSAGIALAPSSNLPFPELARPVVGTDEYNEDG